MRFHAAQMHPVDVYLLPKNADVAKLQLQIMHEQQSIAVVVLNVQLLNAKTAQEFIFETAQLDLRSPSGAQILRYPFASKILH
jgi:hypothetical protein